MNSKNKRPMSFPARMKPVLRWSGHIFLIIGFVALGYVAFVLVEAKLYQSYQSQRFQQELENLKPSAGARERLQPPSPPPTPARADHAKAATLRPAGGGGEGSLLGRIKISSIGLEVMILEGIGNETLRRAVGHIPGTSFPGQGGNVAIAGHRDTFFRPLRNIRKNDEITLTTVNGSYRYRVDSTRVVEPEQIEVLDHSDEAVLTLVTCFPFYFVGAAPQRFIVRAHRTPG